MSSRKVTVLRRSLSSVKRDRKRPALSFAGRPPPGLKRLVRETEQATPHPSRSGWWKRRSGTPSLPGGEGSDPILCYPPPEMGRGWRWGRSVQREMWDTLSPRERAVVSRARGSCQLRPLSWAEGGDLTVAGEPGQGPFRV